MLKKLTILAVILVTAVTGCTTFQSQTLDTREFVGDRESLTHLRMLDGNTGEARIMPPGPDMDFALDFIESLAAQRAADQSPSAGYLYWIAGYRQGKEAFRLTFGGNVISVNNVRYQTERIMASELNTLFERAAYGHLLNQAMTDLAGELGLPIDEVVPIAVEAHTFPDTSLGLPQTGMSYAQVLTPGYILTLSVNGKTYVYHAAGEVIVRAK